MRGKKYAILVHSEIPTYFESIIELFKEEWWTRERTKNQVLDLLNNSSLIFICTNIKTNELIEKRKGKKSTIKLAPREEIHKLRIGCILFPPLLAMRLSTDKL